MQQTSVMTAGQTERQPETQTAGHTERQQDTQREGQTERQSETHRPVEHLDLSVFQLFHDDWQL